MQHLDGPPRRWLLVCAALLLTAAAPAAVRADEAAPGRPKLMQTPAWLGQQYFGSSEWNALEELTDRAWSSKLRAEDGRFQLYLMTSGIRDWLRNFGEDQDENFSLKLDEWAAQYPKSSLRPIVQAMVLNAMAWRARGGGFSSTVTPEGWQLFRQRNELAWTQLMNSKQESSRLPTWYEQAIAIGIDAGQSDATILTLFEEGIARFPGYHPIYFAVTRRTAPRWGGSYDLADAFIVAQVKAKSNPEGEVLYARLYWLLDQYEDGSPEFFTESRVSWPRMRRGFELLMSQFPTSKWNQANFAAFACRAGDPNTYLKLRPAIDAGQFQGAAPEGYSLEVCDARFNRKT